MKSLTFNRNSWHFKLALFGDRRRTPDDLCTYIRYVIYGFFEILAITIMSAIMIAGLSYAFWDAVFAIGFSLYYGIMLIYGGTWVTIIIFSILCFIAFIVWMHSLGVFTSIKESIPTLKEDSFVRQAYKSHKEKYCAKIDFK